MTLAATDQKIYYEGVKQAKSGPFVLMEYAKHCGSTGDELMETNGGSVFFFLPPFTSVAISAPASVILLLSRKWLPFQTEPCLLEQKWKVLFFFSSLPQNQSVIARDLKTLCRYTAQSDVGSIEKCIWFTAGEPDDGSIISKFPGIARGIDYLISHFSLSLWKKVL